uniref:Uncharacterized protein n=1 Tax=Rhizophora mucronata TaxID=61149 RepID=A0A2P2MFZ8_RHIMU
MKEMDYSSNCPKWFQASPNFKVQFAGSWPHWLNQSSF